MTRSVSRPSHADEPGLTLGVELDPDPALLESIAVLVAAETERIAGVGPPQDLAVVGRDAHGRVRAGVVGATWGGCCELEHLWVDPDVRGRGIGRALMRAAEGESIRRGCRAVVLLTHDLQAPGFYRSLGFETIGLAPDYPTGSSARWLRKSLGGDCSPT